MVTGVVVILRDNNVDENFKHAYDLGFKSCQLICWNKELFTDEIAEAVKAAVAKYDLTISTFWCGWSGPTAWNFTDIIKIKCLRKVATYETVSGIRYRRNICEVCANE